MKQDDIRFEGHASRCGYARKDAGHEFMPQSGKMLRWRRCRTAIRVEHALQSGSEIPPYYDSMIAKMIGPPWNDA